MIQSLLAGHQSLTPCVYEGRFTCVIPIEFVILFVFVGIVDPDWAAELTCSAIPTPASLFTPRPSLAVA